TVSTGHDYYRRTIIKKTLLEDRLGLNKPFDGYDTRLTPAISTTTSQDEQFQILQNTEEWLKRPLRGSITGLIVFILVLFCAANALGILGSLWLYGHSATDKQSSPSVVRHVD